jgi:hypothetical protein
VDLLVVGMGTFRAPRLVFNLTTKIDVLLIEASQANGGALAHTQKETILPAVLSLSLFVFCFSAGLGNV